MIRASRERVALLARQVVEELARHSHVQFLRDRESVRQSVLQVLQDELRQDEERAGIVMERMSQIEELPRRGTREWTALWQKLMDEEYERTQFDAS